MSYNGPRHSGGHRPNNSAAQDAAEQALSVVEARQIVSMLLSRVRPDRLQPRDYFPPAAVESRAKSMEQLSQLDPMKIRLLAPDEMATRTADEIRNGVDHQLIDGEMRYWALKQRGEKRAYFEVERARLDPETILDRQLAQNIEREDLTLSGICKSIARYKKEFGRSHKYLAENQFRRFANGDERWVGDRYRVWERAKADAELVELMQLHGDVLTHVEEIVKADSPALRKRMIAATRNGKSVVELKAILAAAKPAPLVAPAPFSRASRAIEIRAPGASPVLPPRESQSREELNVEAAALDWSALDAEPERDAASFSYALDAIDRFLRDAQKEAPFVATSATYTPLAKEALLTRLQRQREALDAISATLQ